ncbi:hypothetical protein PT974_11347 [Cladobotryum mycophilum]|uniref:Pal1-like protein n=1 Tax=Cladobotryum mycophilum TaxID=491253 RepID=A0ABR0S515_9HYPO
MASVGNGARQIKDRALSARSIRVLVTPTPITFAERRSILQVLEQYGAVEMFKMPPGHYSNFISVTKEVTTAERLIASSPLTYNVTEPSRTTADDIYIADLTEPDGNISSSQTLVNMGPQRDGGQAQDRKKQQQQQEQTQFKLEIFPAPEFRHRFAMAGSPLHNSWPRAYERDQSFMATTLKQSLPQTMVGKGLAHWLINLGTAHRMERKAKRLQVKGWLPGNMRHRGTTTE